MLLQLRILTVLVLAIFAQVANAQAGEARHGNDSYAPYRTQILADGIYLMAVPYDYLGFATSNIVLVEQEDGVVVLDTGVLRGDGIRVVALVKSFTSKPVKAIVFTHWHNDHPQGASAVLEAWPDARVIATEPTRQGIRGPATDQGIGAVASKDAEAKLADQLSDIAQTLRQRAEAASDKPEDAARYLRMAREFEDRISDIPGTVLIEPTEVLEDELVIEDRERPVHLRFLGRANTAGDAVLWLPRQKIVATGDVVVAPSPFGFYSYPKDWIETLRKIKALEFELLVPGHGMPQDSTAYVDRLIWAIADIRHRVGQLASEGRSLEETREQVDFSDQLDAFGATPRLKKLVEGYWLRPMIDNAWREANGLPIVQGEGESP